MTKTTATSNIMGKNVRMMMLNAKHLTSGAIYQRPISKSRVEKIVDGFDEHMVNPIKVSFRDGKYWIFDGQHTLVALMVINGQDCMVWCQVHFGLTYEQEARLFAGQHDNSTKVNAIYKAKALAEAEKHEREAEEYAKEHEMKCPKCEGVARNQAPNGAGILEECRYYCASCGWTLEGENNDSN